MISPDLLQAAIISKLKASGNLTTWLAARSSSNEIRESQWQGAAFAYPAVRAGVGQHTPESELSSCYLANGDITFTVMSYSEHDSSKEADTLAGMVNAALLGVRLSGSGFKSLKVASDGVSKAVRTGERVWQATGLYRCYVYET